MAKLIHIIDSNDFNVVGGYQYCHKCPIEDFENSPGDCRKNFKFLFGKSCNDIAVTLKPTAEKMNIEQITDKIK